MIGQTLSAKGERGVVDAEAIHPDGSVLVRINDKWFQLNECEG